MAIDFVHYHQTDLALHTWSGNFNLNDYLSATRAYMLAPAEIDLNPVIADERDAVAVGFLAAPERDLRRLFLPVAGFWPRAAARG